MPMFRKRPIMVEARQLTAENAAEVAQWCSGALLTHQDYAGAEERRHVLVSQAIAKPGDWVVHRGVPDFEVIDDAIFRETYESVGNVAEVSRP